jgi:hypothetical protein
MQRSLRPLVLAAAVAILSSSTAVAASRSPGAHHEAGGAVDIGSPAADLRVALDRLFAEHAFLTIEQMRSGLTDSPDFAAAAIAVEANSTEVAAAIGSVYGDAAIQPFGEIWRSHIGYLVDYAVALGNNDATLRQSSLSGLATYRANLAKFLTDANPGIDLGGITEALDMHTAQLIAFIDAEHEQDHAGAYEIEREAYPHMFHIGDALAKVIANRFPDRYSGVDVAYSAAGTLRVTLDQLLGEHAFLAAGAMRSGIAEAPDFEAAKDAITGNSKDLQAVVQAAYGAAAAKQFRSLWDGHVAGYLAYIDAAEADDAGALAAATSKVSSYAEQLADFLAGANPHLDAAALSALFKTHAQHLTGQVEAFAAGDYEGTYELVRMGYSHMFEAGEALAIGIATQQPKKFPTDAAAPDTATLPDSHPESLPTLGLLLVIGLAVAIVVLGRRGEAGRRNRILR